MIKNIIFDFGNVLVVWDRRYLYDKIFGDDSAREQDFLDNVCTLEWNAQFDKGVPFKEGTEKLAASMPQWREEILAYDSRWDEMIAGEIPGMRELVAEVKAAAGPVYGLTNWSAEKLPRVKAVRPILRMIDNVVCSGEEKEIKPFPRIYEILLERYGLKPEESLFIDDSPANLATAASMGIHTHLFSDAATLRAELVRLGVLR